MCLQLTLPDSVCCRPEIKSVEFKLKVFSYNMYYCVILKAFHVKQCTTPDFYNHVIKKLNPFPRVLTPYCTTKL